MVKGCESASVHQKTHLNERVFFLRLCLQRDPSLKTHLKWEHLSKDTFSFLNNNNNNNSACVQFNPRDNKDSSQLATSSVQLEFYCSDYMRGK